jgi:biotin carboxylase
MHDMARRAHEAVGFADGYTHIEFKLNGDAMHVIEINARLGGGMIPHLGRLTSGVDAPLAAADAVAGRTPDVTHPGPLLAASVRFGYPPYDMEVTSAKVHPELLRPPIVEMEIGTQPGAQVRLPPRGLARSGYVIAVAETLAESRAAVAGAERFFTFTGIPLEPAP